VGLTKSPAESAKVIIAEVNDQMPRTLGDSFLHVSRLTHIVPVSYPIAEMPMAEEGDTTAERIAGYVADLIPDGATMQMGIGQFQTLCSSTFSIRRTWVSIPNDLGRCHRLG